MNWWKQFGYSIACLLQTGKNKIYYENTMNCAFCKLLFLHFIILWFAWISLDVVYLNNAHALVFDKMKSV